MIARDADKWLQAQLDGLRRYDGYSWRHYNFHDLRERAVVEELLVKPWPRVKGDKPHGR